VRRRGEREREQEQGGEGDEFSHGGTRGAVAPS
jgi:hypothetical protein